MITIAQRNAISYVNEYAKGRKENAVQGLNHILKMSNIDRSRFNDLIDNIKLNLRVAFHFHPDRLDPDMKTVAQALFESGIYKSQFETLLSNGSVSAHPGGARDLWEQKLFNGAYQKVENSERPKYGSLNLLSHSDGPSPRFGSCYFLLRPEVTRRCTFTYSDSYADPKEKGTYDELDDIFATLFSNSFSDEVILGERLRPYQLLEKCNSSAMIALEEKLKLPHKRILDHYIEAQVHGLVSLADDVDYLVADPSFKETVTGDYLIKLCEKFKITLHWHRGYVLDTSKVPLDFRGASMPSLAKKVAPDGLLDIKKIGDAAASLRKNPEHWAERGNEKEVLQELKLLWHVLLKFG